MIRQAQALPSAEASLGLEHLAALVTDVTLRSDRFELPPMASRDGWVAVGIAGRLCFDTNPRASRVVRPDEDAEYRRGVTRVDLELVPEAAHRCRLAFHEPLYVSATEHRAWSTPLLAVIRDELETSSQQPILCGAARLLVLKCVACGLSDAGPAHLDDVEIEAVRRRLQSELDHSWSLSELAALAMMSRTTFCARFNRAVGRAPMQYLNDLRMRRARHLLTYSRLPIKEVAVLVGYRAVTAFGHAYKRHSGQSPAAYRSQNQERRGMEQ